ncbi:hypothetical protein [Brevundimonas lenta]|uniref:Uncharacterized protein n=1 Tax=Brevundimonas lenta TaxID=424796 RepID=A0A7W6NNC8_9CAUL|nr:hypothetical protein [Brevundimonas lenta]MBB4082215.1 hypothetical protein [Brevundimonas lenta]
MSEREQLEAAVERAAAHSLQLIETGAGWTPIRKAQDDWSAAVGDLARYLLTTGEPGWIPGAATRREMSLDMAS